MNTALLVAYDGTDFAGWQVQANAPTVQEALERALAEVFGVHARVTGSGRTDAGVHAAGQVCSLLFPESIRVSPERIADALNTRLPPAVRVLGSVRAPEGFDACRAAKRKTYRYSVYVSPREHPLFERYAVRVPQMPDLAAMRACASLLEGEHDFAAFSAAGSSAQTTLRTLYSVRVAEGEELGVPVLHMDFCGNGFLYNMVRILAGALLDVGGGRLTLSAAEQALRTGNRELLGKTLPAKGLTLLSVEYGFPLFARERG